MCASLSRYCDEMVPLHPCLKMISNSEQTLSSHTSRRLITMEKFKEPEVGVNVACIILFIFVALIQNRACGDIMR